MILKDEQEKLGWTFHIECDKCKSFTVVTMPIREQTQRFIYDMGWRANFRARKYVHLCGVCGRNRRARRKI